MTNEPKPGFVTVEDYLKLPHHPNTWLVKDLIPVGGAALLYGLPKTGKSALAIQLACALSGGSNEWMGFKIVTQGPTLYLQLDTTRATWRLRWANLEKAGVKLNPDNLMLADRESLQYFPFDILQPQHMKYLNTIVVPNRPIAVIVDTIRKSHTGDEDNSTNMSNVISNLTAAVHPAALILISHSRKPNAEQGHDLMTDHRGSGSVTGEMDAVMKMTRNRLFYGGRNIEEGDIKLEKDDSAGVLLWKVKEDDIKQHLEEVMHDANLNTTRAKARALAIRVNKSEEAAMSIIRRLHEDRNSIDKSAIL